MKSKIIGIVGNPNCGKTTLFNSLTGAKQRVGNWPGVRVDRKSGSYSFRETTIEVVDTPGIYTLSATSLDERITRDYILSREANCIIFNPPLFIHGDNPGRSLHIFSSCFGDELCG